MIADRVPRIVDWKTVALGEIFDIARGGSPRPIDKFITDDPDGVNWIMISDATSKYITSTKKRIIKEGMKKSREVKPGDFLLTNSMSFGRPYIMQTSGCIHDGWLVLSPRAGVAHPDYFYHLLGSDVLYAEFERRAAGATVKNLNIELVKGVEVLLPPLEEQRRIADVLDRADALRAKRRAALAQLDTLTQSIFLDLFGDPATNSKGWPISRVGDLGKIGTGSTPSRAVDINFGGEIPWVKTTEVNWGVICDTSEKLTQEGLKSSHAKLYPKESLVVALYGQGKTRGKVAVLGVDATTNQACGVLQPSKTYDTSFLFQQLRLSYQRLRDLGRGGNQENLNLALLSNFKVVMPAIPLQREFAQRVACVESVKSVHTASLAELDSLFASLQHRAFRGELQRHRSAKEWFRFRSATLKAADVEEK